MKEQIKEQYEKEYGEIDRIERMAEEESLNFYDELPSKKFNRRDMREAYKTGLLKIALSKLYRTHHPQLTEEEVGEIFKRLLWEYHNDVTTVEDEMMVFHKYAKEIVALSGEKGVSDASS